MRLEAGVEAVKKIKTQTRRYRQAVLKYAFEDRLTEEWRKSYLSFLRGSELAGAIAGNEILRSAQDDETKKAKNDKK